MHYPILRVKNDFSFLSNEDSEISESGVSFACMQKEVSK